MSAFVEAMSELSAHQKTRRGASLYSRFVNRPLGRICAAGAHAVGLSANAVTCLSALVTACGIAILAFVEPSPASGIAVWLLLAFGFVLDSADGQVARLRRQSSPSGEWLDHIVDAAKMVAVHSGVLIGLYRFSDLGEAWLLVPLAFQVVSVVTFAGLTTVSLLKQRHGFRARRSGAPSSARALLLLPVDYGVLCFVFVVWGTPDLFVMVYLVLLAINAAALVAFLAKWFGELRRLDTSLWDSNGV